MGGGTTRKIQLVKGKGLMEKGLKYRPHVDPLPKRKPDGPKDPELDIDQKGTGD
jgi:hypothetical protein